MTETRTLMGFIVAPLVVPAFAYSYFPAAEFVGGAVAMGYLGILALGIPILLFIRAKRWTAWWLAPPVGFICGLTIWFATGALFTLSLDEGVGGAARALHDPAWRSGAIWPGAIGGAATATLFWLIARPDRP